MRQLATKLAVFLLIGAIVNLLVALACDWHMNSTGHSLTLISSDDAKRLGWTGRLPEGSPAAIAIWMNQAPGVFSVGALVGEPSEAIEVDIAGNSLNVSFEFDGESLANAQPRVRTFVVESRAGWPARGFFGRTETVYDPRATGNALPTPRVNVHASVHRFTGRPRSHESLADTLFLRPGMDAPLEPPQNVDAKTSSTQNPLDDMFFSGRVAIGPVNIKPLPAAASGRWNAESLAQNFDRAHRVWPLALRPIWPGFAVNTALYALLAWLLLAATAGARRTLRRHRGRCPGCNYDLRGGPHERCPECGRVIVHIQ